jgi:prepilin-type N-terminal cleavage/methylation domain-containing protein
MTRLLVRTARPGFTLVELLTVVAIIVLLIGILVPAIGAVRDKAKASATAATIGSLSTGLETFRADQRIGGAYPPSASDFFQGNAGSGPLTYTVNNPYRVNPPQSDSPPNMDHVEISGAGLLVWAMAGADLLGTAGFRPTRDARARQFWSLDADNIAGGSPATSGLHALDGNRNRQPMHQRVSLVDTSKIRVSKWDPNAQTESGGPGSFVIEAEKDASDAVGQRPPKRNYPMFLDGWGYPILYWRADPAGAVAVDKGPHVADTGTPTADNRGMYHFWDNGSLLVDRNNTQYFGSGYATPAAPARQNKPLLLTTRGYNSGATPQHKLNYFGQNRPAQPTQLQSNFAEYVRNKATTARVQPQRADSFLLVSPGSDGIFGTADDVTNFEHNSAALR